MHRRVGDQASGRGGVSPVADQTHGITNTAAKSGALQMETRVRHESIPSDGTGFYFA